MPSFRARCLLVLAALAVVAMLVIPRDPIGRTPHPEVARRLLGWFALLAFGVGWSGC